MLLSLLLFDVTKDSAAAAVVSRSCQILSVAKFFCSIIKICNNQKFPNFQNFCFEFCFLSPKKNFARLQKLFLNQNLNEILGPAIHYKLFFTTYLYLFHWESLLPESNICEQVCSLPTIVDPL